MFRTLLPSLPSFPFLLQITDELYTVAKTKPEWQAAAVKALDDLA
jgi:hypothetical protein